MIKIPHDAIESKIFEKQEIYKTFLSNYRKLGNFMKLKSTIIDVITRNQARKSEYSCLETIRLNDPKKYFRTF